MICGGSRIDNFLSPSPDQRLYEDFVGSLLRRKKEKRLTHSLAMSMSRATSIPMDLSSVGGLVQRSVDTINAAVGSTARDHGRSGSARHGSAEQGSGTRAGSRTTRRERDRGRASTRDDASVRDDHRLQNLQDLEGILEVLNDRLDTLERLTRMHGQSIAAVDESLTNHRAQSRAFGDDVEKYKQ